MLQIKSLSKNYGSKVLFENASAFLDERSRVGLVGSNGSGKTTLIRLILGQEHPDQGEIMLHPGMQLGHLAQEVPKFEDRTLMEEVMRLDGRRDRVLALKDSLENEMKRHSESGTTDAADALLNAYSRVLEEVDLLDEYRLPSRAEQILEGVGFAPTDFHRQLTEFSGGWLMRAALARVLLLQPDILILDEPTNHLDLESLLWLEEFLRSYPGALLMVSHDRAFLNRLIDQVWEIDQKKITVYKGDLDAHAIQKEERLNVLRAQAVAQEKKIDHLQSFVDRFGAKATKARQAQSRVKQIEKIERIELPDEKSTVRFRFPSCPPSGREVATIKGAAVRFDSKTVFEKWDGIIQKGTRIAIVGVNGAGKTTLLKTLVSANLGGVSLSEGSIRFGHNVKVGYYSQLQAESLDLDSTILQELETTAPQLEIAQVRAVAGAFLFTGDDVYKSIRVLSGGEKARVALAKLLLTPNNFLLLDEPTNHLDADSREVLLNALKDYEGTLCLVSHDRDFVNPLADQLLEISDHRVNSLVVTYSDYVAKKLAETRDKMVRREKKTEPRQPEKNVDSAPTANGGAKKISNNQRRNWEEEFKRLEVQIVELESKQAKINDQLASQNFEANPDALKKLIQDQTEIQEKMNQALNRWEELGSLL